MTEIIKDKQTEYGLRLQRMIQCETVSKKDSYDDTAFAKLGNVMEELFPLIHKKAEKMTFSDDCWLYKIEGGNTNKNILLMSHHDVAPVSGDWQQPGFSGAIVDGTIWGRGTVDTKSSLFAEFSALEELLEDGFSFPCNVYIASSHNEEIAGDGIPKTVEYFRENKIALDFVLDEGGAVIEPPMAGVSKKCAVLAVHEKGRHTLDLCAKKGPEHSGLSASSETPTVRMAQFIVRIQEEQPYIRKFSPELCAMFSSMAPHMSFPMKFIFSHLNVFSCILKRIIPKLNAQAGAMLGTTGTFQEISTEKDNGDMCCAKLMLRCIDDNDLQAEIKKITEIAKEYGVSVKDAETGNEFHKPASMNTKQFSFIRECMEKAFPDAISVPFILPAGTDARHFSEICNSVFRFAPLDINNQQFKSVHGIDENISLEAIPKAVEFYKLVVRDYSKVIG